jgi:hypothetical protein
MREPDPALMVQIDSLASYVKEREALLIEEEDAMFRAARDCASNGRGAGVLERTVTGG